MKKLLFASSEIFPYAKSGGLADVADALPNALKTFVAITRVMPLYGFLDRSTVELFRSFEIELAGINYKIEIYSNVVNNITNYFVKAPLLSDTQYMYGDEEGDFSNNDIRFGIFCMAIVELAQQLHVDILHLNDWHTALAALFIKMKKLDIKTVFTIHNLAYQGVFEKESLYKLGIDESYFTLDGLEFYSKVNFLKAGVQYSDKVTTVSPSYAKEILTPEYGCGLDGFLAYNKEKISGILNGINYEIFNPKTDKNILYAFDENSLVNKAKNRSAFLKKIALKGNKKPLVIMVTRLVEQKGVDLLIESLDSLLIENFNLVIMGDGGGEFVKELDQYTKEYKNFCFINGYNHLLSHEAYAAADFLLMPSRFEPCGLNQMIAMHYGTVPIVHSVGGLKDSVKESKTKFPCGSGVVFKKFTKKALVKAVKRALLLKEEQQKFKKMIDTNMRCDFSFVSSAKKYFKLYKQILS